MKSLTEQQTKDKLKKAGISWEVFIEWMIGQAGPLIDGKMGYYEWDVDRFIRYKGDPNNEPLVEWD